MYDILPETENILLVIVLFGAIIGTGEEKNGYYPVVGSKPITANKI